MRKIRRSDVYMVLAVGSFFPAFVGIDYHGLVWLVAVGYSMAIASILFNWQAHREKEH